MVHGIPQKTEKLKVLMMNGQSVECFRSCICDIRLQDSRFNLNCVLSNLIPDFDLILGMDAIRLLGGVLLLKHGRPTFPNLPNELCTSNSPKAINKVCTALRGRSQALNIDDTDFTAKFDGDHWTVSWKWASKSEEPRLCNRVAQYAIPSHIADEYHDEVMEWIRVGWLEPFDGVCDGIVPLMAVLQTNKSKVRPVLDFRELNQFVSSHTASSDVCDGKLRSWRKLGSNVSLVDLRKAYLQVHVDPDFWRYQVVEYGGRRYCLTRLGFGLNVAPKIMTAIIRRVLSLDARIHAATDAYVDDIIVNENIVSSAAVINHLKTFGLESKPAVPIEEARVLGLRVHNSNGVLKWKRDNSVEPLPTPATKRDVFSFCGKLLGHFPLASWLRPMCGFLKRCVAEGSWNDLIDDNAARLADDLWKRLQAEDPVCGRWCVSTSDEAVVWTDASSLAIGACLDIGGATVEDGTWLRKRDDSSHINVAELEAVLKGVKMAVEWSVSKFILRTDSASVFAWLNSVIFEKNRTNLHGLSELLVRRRLNLLHDIISEYQLDIKPQLVRSAENKADKMTRVPKGWLEEIRSFAAVAANERPRMEMIRDIHRRFHFGIDKTMFIANQGRPEMNFTREEASRVVSACERCQSIDPAPVKFERGNLDVTENWKRLACDTTHYNGRCYLTVIDCGPSRFATWKLLESESVQHVSDKILEVFRERGPPMELLLDNAPSFKSGSFVNVCKEWGVKVIYRCAFRPNCNGIIERHHRTIKRSASRCSGDILNIVFWYNFSPLNPTDPSTAPSQAIHRYQWRFPEMTRSDANGVSQYKAGDSVYVKPGGARCTTRWKQAKVTRVTPEGAIEVEGVHRHVGDIRHVRNEDSTSCEEDSGEESEEPPLRRSSRVRAQPWRYDPADYQ